MAKFTSVLFDLDGTLTDSRAGIAGSIRHVLRALGVGPPPAENLGWCVGPPLRQVFSRPLGSTDRAVLESAVALYLEHYVKEGIVRNSVYNGVPEMLKELRGAKIRMLLVTSKTLDVAESVLRMFSLRHYFESIVGAGPDGQMSDKAEAIRVAIEREGLSPLSTAMVGDRAHDVLGAKRNGIFSLAVAYGYGTREELVAAGADRICATPAEVAAFVINPRRAPVAARGRRKGTRPPQS